MKKLKKRKMRQMKSTVKRKGNLLSLIKVIISERRLPFADKSDNQQEAVTNQKCKHPM